MIEIKDYLGYGIINQVRYDKRKDIYRYCIKDFTGIILFLNRISKKLKIKKKQSELLLKFYEERLKKFHEHYKNYDQEEYYEMFLKMRELNKRGKKDGID